MIMLNEEASVADLEWQPRRATLRQSASLASVVLVAWQMGMWFARQIVEYELEKRSQVAEDWGVCSACGQRLHRKGFVYRHMLTLVGMVRWRRRVGRCPNRCRGSQQIPFDAVLQIDP